ncbi:MAG: hypothetical protein IPM96_15900 [Ignavibacteria bacterium]|nr:hypothetical protein [Ignavibacteria bacterium]
MKNKLQKRTYKFSNGITAAQDELNLGQDYKIMSLLSGLGIEDGKELLDSSIGDIIKKIVENDLVSELLNIILVIDNDTAADRNWSVLKNSELQKVIEDFFSLNPIALSWLKTIGTGLTSAKTTRSI